MIVYLWIKKFKNIEEQGFLFSSKYNIEFSVENSELSIKANPNYIENFFSEHIKDVTCIVGENGTGKSNIQEYIINCYTKSKSGWDKDHILIVSEKDELKGFYCSRLGNIKLAKDSLQINLICYNDSDDFLNSENPNFYLSNRIIFYSNTFDGQVRSFQNEHDGMYLNDISTTQRVGWALKSNFDDLNLEQDDIDKLSYRRREIKSQIELITKKEISLFRKDFYPDTIEISLTPLYSYIYIKQNLDPGRFNDDIYNKLKFIEDNLYEVGDFNQKVIKKIWFCYLYERMATMIPSVGIFIINQFYNILKEKSLISIEQLFSHNVIIEPYKRSTIEEIFTIFSQFNSQDEKVTIENKDLPKASKIISLIRSLNLRFTDPLAFDWKFKNDITGSLSSGQISLLSLFSRINEGGFGSHTKNGILILDEPDQGFHPEWQRNFLYELLNFLNQYSYGIEQIIITAHSPFILSDIPNDNVLYLKKVGKKTITLSKKQKPNSFGANIHQLLSESFFLQNGLIGEFAKSKIQQMFDYFNKDKKLNKISEDEFQKILPLIGEPLIYSKLAEMYATENGQNGEIARLREIRNKIDKQLENLEKDDTNKE